MHAQKKVQKLNFHSESNCRSRRRGCQLPWYSMVIIVAKLVGLGLARFLGPDQLSWGGEGVQEFETKFRGFLFLGNCSVYLVLA